MDWNIDIVCDVIMVKVNKHLSSPKSPYAPLGCVPARVRACVFLSEICPLHSSSKCSLLSATSSSASLASSERHSTLYLSCLFGNSVGLCNSCPCFT